MDGRRVVSIFCSSHRDQCSHDYQEARILGQLFAQHGWIVQTGGYYGSMEAISWGANKAGGGAIGVTCQLIEDFWDVHPNQWLTEAKHTKTLDERIQFMIENCDAIVILPGSVGTFEELGICLRILSSGQLQPKPLVLVGGTWKQIVSAFISGFSHLHGPKVFDFVKMVDGVEDAVEIICGK